MLLFVALYSCPLHNYLEINGVQHHEFVLLHASNFFVFSNSISQKLFDIACPVTYLPMQLLLINTFTWVSYFFVK
jgi:hypothetical protein